MVSCAHLYIDCFIFGRDIFKVAHLPPELAGLNHWIADKSLQWILNDVEIHFSTILN